MKSEEVDNREGEVGAGVRNWLKDKGVGNSPEPFAVFEGLCKLATVHHELLGHTATQDAGASRPSFAVRGHQVKRHLTDCHFGA